MPQPLTASPVPQADPPSVAPAQTPGATGLFNLLVGVVIIAALFLTREVLIPVTLAMSLHAPEDELRDHDRVDRSLKALYALVEAQGGSPAGPPLGIFHGPINHEDNGPIEVCLPVSGALAGQGTVIE